jgi:hypothetical protein
LAVGVIGAGGRGALNLAAACRAGVTVAALCDVDETALMAARDVAAARNPAVRLYKDFRVMLDAERGLDAVIISTPDHGHGLQAAWALAKGCHVYLETPAVRTLGELRRLRELARSCGAVVQVGDSISASEECRARRGGAEVRRFGPGGRSARLDEPAGLASGDSPPGGQRTRAAFAGLGPVAVRRAGATLQEQGVPPLQLAGLVRLRHGSARRRGL